MRNVLVPLSPGELIDKITILRIKAERIAVPEKVANVRRELEALTKVWQDTVPPIKAVRAEERALEAVNRKLWDVETALRACEAAQRFDAEFVALARAVYKNNDQRSLIKKRINLALSSELIEEKSY